MISKNKCPKCQSDDWKLAKIIYKHGLTHVQATTNSTGVGISSNGIGIGVASSTTSGINQTELSKLTAPPVRRVIDKKSNDNYTFWLPFIFMFGSFAYFFWGSRETFLTASLWAFGIHIVVFLICISTYKDKEDPEYEARCEEEHQRFLSQYQKWEKKKICMRCGTSFY